MKNKQLSQGYSLIEMVMAMAVGSIILIASYSAYNVMAQQYVGNSSIAQVQEMGLPTLNIISRDLRSAGRRAYDDDMESAYDKITTPITITDSGDACCDSIEIIYDKELDDRIKKTYYVAARSNPTRNALYMDIEDWDGSIWNDVSMNNLVADYIEDLQFEGSDIIDSNPALIDMSIIMRSKSARNSSSAYQKADHDIGNYAISTNDMFYRDEFNATVNIKNSR